MTPGLGDLASSPPGGETGARTVYARVFTPPVLAVFVFLSETVCARRDMRPVTK